MGEETDCKGAQVCAPTFQTQFPDFLFLQGPDRAGFITEKSEHLSRGHFGQLFFNGEDLPGRNRPVRFM
jgi:hypothetical protein